MHLGTDLDLLRRARAGDGGAFTELVRRHQSALLRHARALLGGPSRPGGPSGAGAEDVVQEVFLRLAQRPPDLPPGDVAGALVAWLHRVTRNGCMDALKTESRRRRREVTVAAAEPIDGGLEDVDARDTRAAVERGLRQLEPDQREVLVLRLLAGRSYREIAEITGKKLGTVGWLVSTGLKRLSRELAPLIDPPDAASSAASGRAQAASLPGELP